MNKMIKFGEDVEGYNIAVLNEREIRAAAGILFVMMFISILLAALKGDFLLLKYATVIFLTDILIRVLVPLRRKCSRKASCVSITCGLTIQPGT